MRYVFFSTGSWEGNASMVRLRELGKELIARGVEVIYAVDDVPFNRGKLNVDPKAQIAYTSGLGKLSQLWKRRRTLRRLAPDFVHVLNPAPKSGAGLWGSKWRVVGDWDEWPASRPYPFARKMIERYLDRWLRRRAAVVSVCSRYLQREFRAHFGLEAVYIPYAAYLAEQPETTSPFTERTAVYMGNLYPAYDHDLLFDAALSLKQRGKTPKIIFLGDGPDIGRWRDFVKQNGLTNVDVAGYTTGIELWRRLRHAHVLLFPIRVTPLNLARCPSKTYAYAQARRPVIANRVGELPEVLGEKADWVDPTPQAFADAIESAMNGERPDVDYGLERHTWSARADVLMEALNRAAH